MTDTNIELNRDGEQVFQMLWDCRFCGTTKLLGLDHRHCPNCGAQQDPKWRYFPSDADMKLVTDPDYKYAGVDTVCPFCSTPNSANAKFCKQCGADLVNGKPAEMLGNVSTGLEGAEGKRKDLVLEEFNQQNAQPIKAKGGIPTVLLVVLGLVAAVIIGLVILSRSTYAASMKVNDLAWERNIYTEQYAAVPGAGWQDSVPFDAYGRTCSPRQRAYTEQERYQCGYEMSDRGDGSGSRRAKYCTRSKTRYETENYCSYVVNRWTPAQTYNASGGATDPLTWPAFTPRGSGSIGATRETRRETRLSILFEGLGDKSGKTFTYDLSDESRWMTFKPGQTYSVDINRLEQVQWNSLKPLAQ